MDSLMFEITEHETLDDAVIFANVTLPISVYQFIQLQNKTVIIWGFDCYPRYLHWCRKQNIEPISSKEFFK